MSIKIYETKPADFEYKLEVVGCFVESGGKILFLKRAPHCPEPNFWGLPGGKVEPKETLEAGIVRELFEETGITSPSPFTRLGTIYCSKPHINYAFHLFKLKIKSQPPVILSPEHLEFTWIKPTEVRSLNLMPGAEEIVKKYMS